MRKPLRLLVVSALICLLAVTSSAAVQVMGAQTGKVETSVTATRTVPLSIKIVFIGFNQSTMNTTYMLWKENIPFKRVNQVLTEPRDTGVTFELTYDFVFANSHFEKQLTTFLKGIEVTKSILNPWFGVPVNSSFYDANKLEDWLYRNREIYGGFPSNGYTFFVANLTQLPSVTYDQLARPWLRKPPTPHYYSVEYFDLDLGYKVRNREFMTGWGGHYRFWFLDLSAGPSFNTPSDAPIQAVVSGLEIDLQTAYGVNWLTEYLSDYIWESVWNLAVPQFVYQPKYAEKYSIVVTILDNRTKEERSRIPVSKTVNSTLIKRAYMNLVPYSDVEVKVNFRNCSDDQELLREMSRSYKPSTDPAYSYVDLRPLYRYLQTRLSRYVANASRDEKEFTIPVFCFVFSKSYLGYTYKWDVSAPPTGEETFWGLAQEDMVVCALTQVNELNRGTTVEPPQPNRGIGFTQLVIHEVGHMIGLMHPHQYGDVHDFVASAMSYFCHDYNFSQFDKDALHRMHTDSSIIQTLVKMTEARGIAATKITSLYTLSKFTEIEDLLTIADKEYLSMNYTGALASVLKARELVYNTAISIGRLPNALPFWAQWIFVLGFALGYFVRKSFEGKPTAESKSPREK
jgi:hypothetical protein